MNPYLKLLPQCLPEALVFPLAVYYIFLVLSFLRQYKVAHYSIILKSFTCFHKYEAHFIRPFLGYTSTYCIYTIYIPYILYIYGDTA